MCRIKSPGVDLYLFDLQEKREVPLRFKSKTVILSMNATGSVATHLRRINYNLYLTHVRNHKDEFYKRNNISKPK